MTLPTTPNRVTLAGMPSYLQRLHGTTRTQVTPCWLHEEDATKAAADLENIRVVTNDRWANIAPFGKLGSASEGVRELMAERWWAGEVDRLTALYRGLAGRHGERTRRGAE